MHLIFLNYLRYFRWVNKCFFFCEEKQKIVPILTKGGTGESFHNLSLLWIIIMLHVVHVSPGASISLVYLLAVISTLRIISRYSGKYALVFWPIPMFDFLHCTLVSIISHSVPRDLKIIQQKFYFCTNQEYRTIFVKKLKILQNPQLRDINCKMKIWSLWTFIF